MFTISDDACVGCNMCALACPVEGCITMEEVPTGKPPMNWNQYQAMLKSEQVEADRAEEGGESVTVHAAEIVASRATDSGDACASRRHRPTDKIKEAMIAKHIETGRAGCRQGRAGALLSGTVLRPILCRRAKGQMVRVGGARFPTARRRKLFCELAKKHQMVIVLPIYEEDLTGVYYNTAAVIDADGTFLGKFRKMHIPHCEPGFWEKFYFRPGNLGYPVFETRVGKVGVYICYDRHFPEGWRELGLAGAEIVFNPSATVAGLSEYLWKLEQPAAAANNIYYVGAINRPGFEEPWRIGEFYGSSYFADPRGQIIAQGARGAPIASVIADLDLDVIRQVRNVWQFYRDRRPESYSAHCRAVRIEHFLARSTTDASNHDTHTQSTRQTAFTSRLHARARAVHRADEGRKPWPCGSNICRRG